MAGLTKEEAAGRRNVCRRGTEEVRDVFNVSVLVNYRVIS